MKRSVFFLCAVMFATSLLSKAQEVGLVFSGGAAKGLAHIGVLKALEENDIPVDYITGTSMGAVVGAFYAAGYSPEEIEELALAPTFQNWINGQSTEKYKYNYTKSEDNASWLTVDLLLDSKTGPSLNTPLANDLILNFVLSEYLGQASQVADYNFDRLFVPFRAVAAEVFSQEVVSLDSGSLIQATRASMAVPFFYRPIKFEDQYLFDGGIYNNFPVDIMERDFDPEIVIGANVATSKETEYPYETDEQLLTDALLFLFLDKTDPSKIDSTGIYLAPDLKGATALDFDLARQIIDAGYQETIARMESIKERINRRVSKTEVAARRTAFRDQFEPFRFGDVKLVGFDPKQEKFVYPLFECTDRWKTLDDMRESYFQLVSEPYFKNVYPNISYNEDLDYYVFELYLKPTAKNTLSIDLGGNLSTRGVSTLQVGLQFNRFNRFLNTFKVLASTGGFYESMAVAGRINISAKNRFFIEPNFHYNNWNYLDTDDFLNDNFDPTILDRIDRNFGLMLGIGTGSRSVITLSGNYISNGDRFSNTTNVTTTDVLDLLEFDGFRGNLSYERNSLNLKQFPTDGSRFFASLDYFNGEEKYTPGSTSALNVPGIDQLIVNNRSWWRMKVQFEEYKRLAPGFTIGVSMDGVYSSQPNFGNFRSSLIYANAFEPIFDSKTFFLEHYRAYSYLGLGLKSIFCMNKRLQFRTEIYGFSAIDGIREGLNQTVVELDAFEQVRLSWMLAGIYTTPVGPLSLRFSYYDDPQTNFGVMLSFGYHIFHHRSDE